MAHILLTVWCSFFEEAPRIGHQDYIPTESDVLRARTKTTGIYETRFSMGQLSIQFVALLLLLYINLANDALACSTLADSEASGKSGSTVSRQLRRSSSAWHLASMTKCCWRKKIRYACSAHGLLDSRMVAKPSNLEPDDGELSLVRFRCQQSLVCADQYNPLPEQGGSVQSEAGPEPTVQLLSRLFRRKRCQPCGQISPMEIQPGQSCPPQPLSAVCQSLFADACLNPVRLIPKAALRKQQTHPTSGSCLRRSRRRYYKTP
jgi:hypothetical protein